MSLSISDVNLERYFFTTLFVKANTEHKGNEEAMTIFSVEENVHDTQKNGHFAMELSVTSNDEESTNLPYSFALTAFGFFNVESESADEDEKKGLCTIIGRRVLMGAVREQVASLTSRGPWSTIHLKAISGGVSPLRPGEPDEPEKPQHEI